MELEDLPLQFDDWVSCAVDAEKSGKWDIAARIYRHIASVMGNEPNMMLREANALYHFGDYRQALDVLALLVRPTIASMIVEARCLKELDKPEKAIKVYEKAEQILERKV